MAFDSDSISMKRRKLQYGWGVLIGKRIEKSDVNDNLK